MTYSVLVLGGGQLARMMLPAASRLDIDLTVLDPSLSCPACSGANRAIAGDFADYDAIIAAAAASEPDAVTIEIEHVSTRAMAEIARRGVPVHPGAETLEAVNDKLRQRQRLREAGLPMPRFFEVPGSAPPKAGSGGAGAKPGAAAAHSPAAGEPSRDKEIPALLHELGLPAVQKLRFGGYDGRGVAMIREDASPLPLPGPSMLEAKVDIAREVAVLVARSASGEAAVYEPVEMEMDPELHLVRSVFYPATLDPELAESARRVAMAAAEALSVVGICAVELFVSKDGEVLVNEVAPRPHNSGHLTLEAAETDQFEQHLRAVLGLPLGNTRMRSPAVMRNLVGRGEAGPATYAGLREVLGIPGAHLHLYGKEKSRPGRKMGHLTVCADSLADAQRLADRAISVLTVQGIPG